MPPIAGSVLYFLITTLPYSRTTHDLLMYSSPFGEEASEIGSPGFPSEAIDMERQLFGVSFNASLRGQSSGRGSPLR